MHAERRSRTGHSLLAVLLALVLLAAACGGSDGDGEGAGDQASGSSSPSASSVSESASAVAEPTEEAEPADQPETVDEADAVEEAEPEEPLDDTVVIDDSPIDVGRVVALGEDELLANLLAMGITPILTSTNGGDGPVGIERDTAGIEWVQSFEINPEQIAGLGADLLITTQGFVDQAGAEAIIDGLAAEVVVLQEPDIRARVIELGEALGIPERSEALVASYDQALAEARDAVDSSIVVSMASVYDFAYAAWVDGPSAAPATVVDLGVTLSPGPGDLANESFGRVRPISEEQLPLLDGDLLILLQNFELDSESAALEAASDTPLWQAIPAVAADNVVVLDRIGYQGIEGRIRLIGDLVAALEGLS
ncbi:MAG: ABC transporter substrate-binding protein [Actinomycetota bacterium]